MRASVIAFWSAGALCAYVYAGYPALTWVMGACRSRRATASRPPTVWPSLSLICCAYNEAGVIRKKIQNCLALDYPQDRLEVILVSDASTDETDSIVQEYSSARIRLIRQPVRSGKDAGLNVGAAQASGEILVFTDANSIYDPQALRNLVTPFGDPTVGAAVGRLRHRNPAPTAVSTGETLYWRYEGVLKKAQASAGALLFANGAIHAVRRFLQRPVTHPWHDYDTLAPLQCLLAGYRVVYVPEALAWEEASTEAPREFQRRVRTLMRDGKTYMELKLLLVPLRPWLAFNLISSKVLRWLAGPMLVLLLAANAFLLGVPFYRIVFAAQLAFYVVGAFGLMFPSMTRTVRLLSIPTYFCLVNVAVIVGLGRLLIGENVPRTWEPRGGI